MQHSLFYFLNKGVDNLYSIRVITYLLLLLNRAIAADQDYPGHDFHQWEIVPLHSTITSDEQQKVFQAPKDYYRKIILSTNIAESSVTVPDVMYGKLGIFT